MSPFRKLILYCPPSAIADGHRFISPSSPSKNSGLKSKDLSGDILETLKSKSDLLTERGIEVGCLCGRCHRHYEGLVMTESLVTLRSVGSSAMSPKVSKLPLVYFL